jgi:hypothetical protein
MNNNQTDSKTAEAIAVDLHDYALQLTKEQFVDHFIRYYSHQFKGQQPEFVWVDPMEMLPEDVTKVKWKRLSDMMLVGAIKLTDPFMWKERRIYIQGTEFSQPLWHYQWMKVTIPTTDNI